MAQKIQIRRDTTAAWAGANPVLAQGEMGLNTTLMKIKIGDGGTPWNSLPYVTDHTEPGKVLAYAVSSAYFAAQTIIDIPGLTIAFTVPADRDVLVVGRTALQGHLVSAGISTLTLADAAGAVKDVNSYRAPAAGYYASNVEVHEVIPAGTAGTITRVLRLSSASASAFVNLTSAGKSMIQAIVR